MTANAKTLRNVLGNPVHGADFWPRPDVVEPLFDALAHNKGSRRLFGLRRIGKTSVILELERRLRAAEGLTVIHIDTQDVNRFRDFLFKVLDGVPAGSPLAQARKLLATNRALQSLAPTLFERIFGIVAPKPEQGFRNEFEHMAVWTSDIEAALKQAAPIVLIIDELPYMLRNMMQSGYTAADAGQFLATLRSWRINCGVRMLLTGSIGFAQLGRLDGVAIADHTGDLYPETLPPLSRDEAVGMVNALARHAQTAGWTKEKSEAVVDASAELWPIFLHYGFDAATREPDPDKDPPTIRAIVERDVRQALDETFYSQFTTRLSRYDADEKAARAILKAVVAANPEPTPFDAIDRALDQLSALDRRDDLLEALREDDFIQFDTSAQTLRAASKLVPLWVRARAWGR